MTARNFPYQFDEFPAHTPFISDKGALTQVARYLLLAFFNRTGAASGIVPLVSPPLTAQGNSRATALQLGQYDWNYIGSVPSGSGVFCPVTPPFQPGNDIQVYNADGQNLNFYPSSAGIQIDALGAGNPYVIVPGKLRIFAMWTPTQMISYGN